MKNIVLCSDGTGNRDVKARGSNVFKLYEAVDIQGYKRDPAIPVQLAYYDDGVGSESLLPLKILGGAFGVGIACNVRELYTQLARVYEPRDRIFLFGFSRGAYTVRTLSGMIQYCGIVDHRKFEGDALDRQVKECWREFRTTFTRFVSGARRRGEKPQPGEGESSEKLMRDADRRRRLGAVEHEQAAPGGRVNIDFIGVWDTVCAVGMPFDELRDFLNYFVYPIRFSDLTAGDQVGIARHALAIDDERRTFWPELWNERGARPGQVEQVWFSGAHSNVGGGYPKQGMSLVALDWMMAHAEAAGLRFIPEARQFVRSQQDVHDKLYDSRSGLALYYRWDPRDIARYCRAHGIEKPRIHVSVFERIAQGSAGYAPGNLPFDLEVVATPDRGVPSWPGAARLQAVARLVSASSAAQDKSAGSLLGGNQSAIILGKLSYYAFLLATVLILAGATCSAEGLALIRPYADAIPLGGAMVNAIEWGRGHFSAACPDWSWKGFLAAFLVCGGLAWALSAFVDRWLGREYAGFWHALRDRLRSALG